MEKESQPLFLLGAGFNADAKREAGAAYGESINRGRHEIKCEYPLVAGIARIGFELDPLPEGKSVEDLFQQAQDAQNFGPMRRLADQLFWADDFIGGRLVPRFGARPNRYSDFFDRFPGANFITFNYDSLSEVLLFHSDRWCPHDGYGVDVEVDYQGHEALRERVSASLVLHLHGTLCVYTSRYAFDKSPAEGIAWRVDRDQPLFSFDPHSISQLFNHLRGRLTLGFDAPERRVIAPVRSKAKELKRQFIESVYRRADAMIRSSGSPIVAIGYSFNIHDAASYEPLLTAAAERGRQLLLVIPDAAEVSQRLIRAYPTLPVEPVEMTFAEWVEAGFGGP